MNAPIDFTTLTACGECCTGCAKKLRGDCPGCIEADGRVPEWAQSGQCRVHACARSHGVSFCGLCSEFPCEKLPQMIPWNPNIFSHMRELALAYHQTQGGSYAEGLRPGQAHAGDTAPCTAPANT